MTRGFYIKILVTSSLILYSLSIILVYFDTGFTYRWLSFWLHILSVGSIIFLYIIGSINKTLLKKALREKEIIYFGLILILAETVSLLFLKDYPFVSVGDEVRDGGLNAMQIATGSLKNIFDWGRYESHSLIIPTLTSFFYNLFGSSVFVYRFPAAIISVLNVIGIYLLLRILIDRNAAFFGALFIITLPFHLFFARTEIVVILSIFLTTIILIALFLLLHKRNLVNYILLGVILGFASGFHASVRIIAVLAFLLVAVPDLWEFLKLSDAKKIKQSMIRLFALIFFILIGFGPRILFTTPSIFFHTDQLSFKENLGQRFIEKQDLEALRENYKKSLMVWFYEPTTSRYPDHKPILTPPLALVFLLGIGYSLFVLRRRFLYMVIILAFIVPFTNSAITSWVNADHRLNPLFPIGSIFVAIGISYILSNIRKKVVKIVFVITICSYFLFQLLTFFVDQPANKNKNISDYLSMHVIYFLKSTNSFINPSMKTKYDSYSENNNICLFVSPANFQTLNLLHYKEQYEYFLPKTVIEARESSGINDSDAYIFKGSCPDDYRKAMRELVVSCSNRANFDCPINYFGEIIIHY